MDIEIDTLREQERKGTKWRPLQHQCKDLEHSLAQVSKITQALADDVNAARMQAEKRKGELKKERLVYERQLQDETNKFLRAQL